MILAYQAGISWMRYLQPPRERSLYNYLTQCPSFKECIGLQSHSSPLWTVTFPGQCFPHCTGTDLSLKGLAWSKYNPKRQLMPGKSKTTWQRGRRNRHCHMVWIWDFFSSVAFFTLVSSFLPSSWKKTLKDLRSQFSWFILQPFSRIKKEGGGRGNFSFRSSWCPVHFLLCFLLHKKATSLLAQF